MTIETSETTVDSYLRRLDRAARWLPRGQAEELREQVVAHLADSSAAGGGAAVTAQVLRELGEPELLVREAAGPRRSLRNRIRRVRWWTWSVLSTLLAGVIAAVVVLTVVVLPEYHAGDLVCSCGQAFVGHRDGQHDTDIGGFQAMSVIARRSGQGVVFDLFNPTRYSQTVLGFPAGYGPWGDQPGVYTLGVGTASEHGFPMVDSTFALPVRIPPGQNRAVRIEWHNLTCSTPGAQLSASAVQLRVRVGHFTRTETVQLPSAFVLRYTAQCATP